MKNKSQMTTQVAWQWHSIMTCCGQTHIPFPTNHIDDSKEKKEEPKGEYNVQ